MTRDREGDRVRQTGHVPRGMAVPRRVWRGVGARGWQAPCPLPSAAQAARPRCRPGTASQRKISANEYDNESAVLPFPPVLELWGRVVLARRCAVHVVTVRKSGTRA